MSVVIWVSPADCDPPHGLDMESHHDARKVDMLIRSFHRAGFDKNMPALIGYPREGRIQLLSGTHRHRAALHAGIKLPVVLWLGSDVEEAWGRDNWRRVMEDIPVNVLEGWGRREIEEARLRLPKVVFTVKGRIR